MANFKIDGVDYDTEKLDTKQRVIALYQQSVKDEAEALQNSSFRAAGLK